MAAEAAKAKLPRLYREMLKAVKKHYGAEDYRKHFKPFVTKQFRMADVPHLDRRIKLAQDYIRHLNKATHQDMLFPPNYGTDTGSLIKEQLDKSIEDGFHQQNSSDGRRQQNFSNRGFLQQNSSIGGRQRNFSFLQQNFSDGGRHQNFGNRDYRQQNPANYRGRS